MEEIRIEICRREKSIQNKLYKFKGSIADKIYLQGGLHEIQDLKEIIFKLQTLQVIEKHKNKTMKKNKVKIPN